MIWLDRPPPSKLNKQKSSNGQGYKNRPNFLKFDENGWNRASPNLKTVENIIHCFKILEKDKNQQNICKKLDRILRLLVKKFL
jgi:hypothetical protein